MDIETTSIMLMNRVETKLTLLFEKYRQVEKGLDLNTRQRNLKIERKNYHLATAISNIRDGPLNFRGQSWANTKKNSRTKKIRRENMVHK